MKIILSLLVIVMWAMLLVANVAAAGRTAAQMENREGIPRREAERRTTPLVLLWAVLISGAAIVALVLVWRH